LTTGAAIRGKPDNRQYRYRLSTSWMVVLAAALLPARPAFAQLSGSVAFSSNELFRGESISNNVPAASLALSLDHRSGLFLGGGASLAIGEPRLVYANQYAGYALRRGQTSFEAGIIHRSYDRIVDTDYRRGFFEAYAGVTHKSIKARLYVSPDYRRDGRTSYYGELNARLLTLGNWGLDGHAGVSLIPQPNVAGAVRIFAYRDWRVQISRPLGPLFLSGGVASSNYPVYSASGRARPFLSISHAF
jgi:uncharacterized protein (TIGR02001 family)